MRKIDYKEGRELEKTHVCKECGGGLVTAWSPLYNHHVIRCSEDVTPVSAFVTGHRPKQMYHEGEVRKGYLSYHEQPQEIKDMLDRKERNGRK